MMKFILHFLWSITPAPEKHALDPAMEPRDIAASLKCATFPGESLSDLAVFCRGCCICPIVHTGQDLSNGALRRPISYECCWPNECAAKSRGRGGITDLSGVNCEWLVKFV